MTVDERQKYKELRAELKERKENGYIAEDCLIKKRESGKEKKCESW